jgi:hypothetical protein
MYFCNDVDLMVWEPAIFGDAAFGHQRVVREAAGTLTGGTLAMAGASLGSVLPGMAGQIVLADDSLAQLLEIVSVPDASHAVVSGLRARSDGDLVVPLVGGSVKVTVMTFRAQIAAVGDELLGLIGLESDRDSEPDDGLEDLRGFRIAAVMGTLAAVLRTMSTASEVSAAMLAKRDFYQKTYLALRRRLEARVDGAERRAGVGVMGRE